MCCNDNAAVSLTCTTSTLLSKPSLAEPRARPQRSQAFVDTNCSVPLISKQFQFHYKNGRRRMAGRSKWCRQETRLTSISRQLCRKETFSQKSFSAQHVSYVSRARLLPEALLKVNRVLKDASTSDPGFPLQASAPHKLMRKLLILRQQP